VKSKAAERDIGKIDTGTALAVAVGMEIMVATEGSASLVKGAGDFAVAGAERCGCLARVTCAT
jgi:hypothetical protein